MKPRTAIGGNWAPVLLPINEDDSIDFGRLATVIDLLIAAGVDGVYSNGTAGEFHNQTEAEYDAIQTLMAEKCRAAGMPFVIGACHADPGVSRERTARAAALRPEAIQIILPDWLPVTDAEAMDFLRLTAGAAGNIPLILYNPPHAKRVLSPDDLAGILADVPTVVGVKLATGDAAWREAARRRLGEIALFVPGHRLATETREGVAAGSFSNVACLSPRGTQRWTDLMRTDIEAALDLERRLCRFIDAHVLPFREKHGYSNAALDKLLATIGGWGPIGTRLRRPYRWIPEAEADRLRPIARRSTPELFAD